jgi:hypothetical protein
MTHQTTFAHAEFAAKQKTICPAARATIPKILVLHHANLKAEQVERRAGFAVTRPLRTIADVATVESVSRDIIKQSLTEGRQRGLINAREIADLRGGGQIPKWFDELLVEHQR